MVICPIARAVHCSGCPLFKLCPAKSFLGDHGKKESADGKPQPGKKVEKAQNKDGMDNPPK